MAYAATTSVSVSRTQEELKKLLTTRDAKQIAFGWSDKAGQVGFELQGRIYKMTVPTTGNTRTKQQEEQLERSRWRVLFLTVKAKLEAADSGLTSVEQEFLAYATMPNGESVYSATKAAIDAVYSDGQVRPLLALDR